MKEENKLKLLNRLLKSCRNSSFYRSRIPDKDLNSLDELKQLPITTKEDTRDNSPYGFVCVPREELCQYHETFGTTGVPVSTWLCSEDVLDLARRVNDSGINFSDKDMVLIRFPYAISTVAHFVHNAAQMQGACVIPASSRTTVTPYTRVVNLMKKLDVTVLAALPTQAVLIAETAELMGLDPGKDFPALRAIYTAGEAMTPNRRKVIKSLWKVALSDNYGMTEFGPAVTDCEYEVPHPLQDSYVFEILEDDLKTDVKPGTAGNLVVTTLTRRATPLIRYLTGDMARLYRKDCPCGREEVMEIRGRRADNIDIGGRTFDIWDLGEIVSELPCRRFWAAGRWKDTLKFVVEEENPGDTVSGGFIGRMQAKYGVKLSFEIVPKGTLYDRGELLSVGVVGKPKYIYTEEEMEKKAYFKSSKS